MIAAYFAELEQTIQSCPNILRSILTKKQYNARQGCISGSVSFDNGCRLEFMELKDCDRAAKVKYRYQYMDEQNACLFRYDNAPHHPEFATFPHHSWQSWRPDEPLRGEAQREHHLKECHGQLLEKQ